MQIQFIGYAPDLDYATPGVITDCNSIIPTTRGMKAAPSLAGTNTGSLAAACVGSALVVKLDNTYRVLAGTQTGLFEAGSATWTDVTRAVGGAYSTSSSDRWRMSQFGDTSLACNGADLLQSSNSGSFANVAGSPIARCMDTCSGFVMLGGVDLGGGAGMEYDRWICSAYNDSTDWTPAVSTQCTTGRLVDTPGRITGVRKLGYNAVYYKERSMYFATYVGAPAVWDFQLLPGEIGAPSQEAVVNIGPAHIFVGYEDIYLFDGSRPTAIGSGIRDTFFADLNKRYRDKVIGSHDFLNSLVYFYYPSISSSDGSIDSCIVYNYKTGKWGRDDRSIEAAIEYLTGQITYANIGDYFSSYSDITVSYDSPFWVNSSPLVAVFDTTHTLYTLAGTPGTSDLTTGDIGDDSMFVLLSRDRPRFKAAPSTATMTNYYSTTSGSSMTTDATTSISNGAFDVLRSAPWHRLKYTFTGEMEIVAHDVTIEMDGDK